MSTLLHQAVQLAQAGQRSEARQLIWQFLQSEPNNETAWLWLASVASDQAEYQRSLNEVLRINPDNQRAKQLLTEFQQQYGSAPPAVSPYAPPQQQASPPPVSPYAPPQQQVGTPPQYGVSPPVQPPSGVPYAPSKPVEVQVKTVQKRQGCLGCSVPGCGGGCLGCGGCGQGCLLAFLVLIILPALLCGGLSLSSISLGPFDVLPGSYLPGEMGRKTIQFVAEGYDVSLKAPRSWYLVETNDQMWGVLRDVLEETLPFEGDNVSLPFNNSSNCQVSRWSDLEACSGVVALIVDTNPISLAKNGDIVRLVLYPYAVEGDYSCEAVRAANAGVSYDYPAVYEYNDNLCGYREQDSINPGPAAPVLKSIDPPAQTRTITFYTPVSQSTAAQWQITMPENMYDRLEKHIEQLIGSVKIHQQ
jgi:hypothetical protein